MTEMLGWIGVAGAVVAVVLYFILLAQRPKLVRLLNGSGLFFGGLALSQAPFLLEQGADRTTNAAFAVVFLLLSVFAQGLAALRNRKAWDGRDRRAAPEWDGSERRESQA